jgi:hypothetical protein
MKMGEWVIVAVYLVFIGGILLWCIGISSKILSESSRERAALEKLRRNSEEHKHKFYLCLLLIHMGGAWYSPIPKISIKRRIEASLSLPDLAVTASTYDAWLYHMRDIYGDIPGIENHRHLRQLWLERWIEMNNRGISDE